MVLERKKYLVDTSRDLESAFHQFSMKQHSVIVTEYLHPIEDLYHMIQWVKHNSPATCIIMVTSLILDEPIYEKLFDLGLDDFILKPYPPEKILVHIRKGLKQRELVLKKQDLERQSLLDPIGQLIQQFIFNSTYFKKCLHQEIGRAKRHQHPLSLLLIQIPDGGAISDRFEDFCIELVKIVRRSIREEDMFGRENGSFGIILPETDEVGSQALVRRLSNLIQTHSMFQSDKGLRSIIQALSFQTFTYPEKFIIPESLKNALEEDSMKKSPQ
jgi:diguanylate cyclase (GGDEF)-like protein